MTDPQYPHGDQPAGQPPQPSAPFEPQVPQQPSPQFASEPQPAPFEPQAPQTSQPSEAQAQPVEPQQPAPTAPPAPAPASPPGSELRDAVAAVRAEVAKSVVGQDGAVSGLLIALLAGGHVLLEGVPGVAKTLLVRTLSHALSLDTKRVQFTPDLMPGDITGSIVYDAKSGDFEFREGPVFTNILLADEINRTPPKTQSALLEAMEERQVSADGITRRLPSPFLVAATQNPVEYEGTYTLPEAQLDRFLLKLVLDLPERDAEVEVLSRHARGFNPRDLDAAGVRPVLDAQQLAAAQAEVQRVPVSPDVLGYAVDLARATRTSPSVKLGVSPRGTTALLAASRAWAWMTGASGVTPDHVQAMAIPVLRHRIQLRPEAELEGVGADTVLRSILQQVRVPI
ncbi:MoxR family ATPase [Schumannella sp. 10F1B-5-1]|uniref:AAA family ATPase n=1 Tax=Schumannella sp. 10F1B-5-1 TaxID=2590780 RepID=UPI0011300E08|nr:MoxR family ATPase [Schumannella sp. 10F1B-5-1]TPW73582.1 MoxR family ATPase [Schumannella sp. 10F1B-5-1]